MSRLLLLLVALPVQAADPFPQTPQDPKALTLLVRKAVRLGKDSFVPTAQAAGLREVANANLPAESLEEQDTVRAFKETDDKDKFEGNVLGLVLGTAALPMQMMDNALSETMSKSGRAGLPSLAGLPAHTPAKLLQARDPGPPPVTRHFYALTQGRGPAPKVLRLVFRRIEPRPGTMDLSRRETRQEWGESASCWYTADPEGKLLNAVRVGDQEPCRGYCAELEAWLGSGCLAGAGWLEPAGPKGPE